MESKTLRVKYMGEEYWGRKVYENIDTGRIYQEVDGVLHTTTHMGEPDCPLRNEIEVVENE